MNSDLISRDDLKKQVKELLELAVKRVDDTPTNSPCYRMYVAQENERARLIDLIDNAPTVEPCKDCEDKRQAEYIRHGSSWHELQALRKYKEEHERPQGKWIPVSERLPDKMGKYLVTSEDIIFKIVIFDDHLISVVTDDIRGRGYGMRGNYQFTDLLELAESINMTLRLNPKFELVRGKEE